MDGAKKMIAEFRDTLMNYLMDGKKEEVFQFSSQFFSIDQHSGEAK